MSNEQDKVFNRFLEVLDYIDRKYVNYLEEIVILEAELDSCKSIDSACKEIIFYINLVKNMIINELGIQLKTDSTINLATEELLSKTIEATS